MAWSPATSAPFPDPRGFLGCCQDPPQTSLRRSRLIPSLLPIAGTPLHGPFLFFSFCSLSIPLPSRKSSLLRLTRPVRPKGCSSLPIGRPGKRRSPGCTPPHPAGMECPWVVSWEEGGRKGLLTLACSGCLTQIPPPHVPRSPAPFLGGKGSGALQRMHYISQAHAEGQEPGGEGGMKCNRLDLREPRTA